MDAEDYGRAGRGGAPWIIPSKGRYRRRFMYLHEEGAKAG
jgi:hypothetical protein